MILSVSRCQKAAAWDDIVQDTEAENMTFTGFLAVSSRTKLRTVGGATPQNVARERFDR